MATGGERVKFHCYGVISQCKRFSQTADVREACKALVRVWWFDPFEKHRNQLFWWRNCQWERLLLENVGNNSWFIAVSFQHVSDVVGFMCFPFVAAREVGCHCWCIWSFKIFFVLRVNFKKLGSSIRKLEMMKRYGNHDQLNFFIKVFHIWIPFMYEYLKMIVSLFCVCRGLSLSVDLYSAVWRHKMNPRCVIRYLAHDING